MNEKDVVVKIVDWLVERNIIAGTNGFVVGISGGIDSSVTSTLCAMTGKQVMVLEMPINANPTLSKDHAIWLTKIFKNVSAREVYLGSAFDIFKKSLYQIEDDEELVWANAMSRLRMVALYCHANRYNMLVCGTGNKVEDFGVGFFTKYGDGGVDISPIADLYKSEVYKLGAYFGIDERIMKAKPTDGLWGDNRSDEDQIGATYDELEWAMKFQAGLPMFGLTERQKEAYHIYTTRQAKNLHKVEPIPVCKFKRNSYGAMI